MMDLAKSQLFNTVVGSTVLRVLILQESNLSHALHYFLSVTHSISHDLGYIYLTIS